MGAKKSRNLPPVATRFRKGQSGNSRGRPKKPPKPQPSAFDVVIDRRLTIIQGGKPREVALDEALQHKTYRDAIAGNRAARREVLKMIARREKEITKRAPSPKPVEVIVETEDPTNADEALLILGIACRDLQRNRDPGRSEQLVLEPWGVAAALRRRAARRMNSREIQHARRCTRDSDSLRWPRPVEP